jgi:3-phosphoshikimate 1-carboxyvinyltransferase
VSSQYISALLLIAPALPEGLQIRVEKQNSVSSTYLKTTINTLQNVGYQAIIHNFETYEIFSVSAMNNENKSFLTQEKVLEVPADWSSATYFFSIAALLPPNISIELLHLKPNDAPQADEKIMEFAAPFLHISRTESGNFVLKQRTIFLETPNTIDCTECPDLAQTLAVLFAAKRKKVLLTGLKTLRIKETDRIFALASELAKIGVQTQTTADSLAITDFEKDFTIDFDTKTIHISTYNDHRMAMAFAPLALVLPRIGIENAGVVSKSFPHFWAEMRKLGIS